jgi:hypothetical protein
MPLTARRPFLVIDLHSPLARRCAATALLAVMLAANAADPVAPGGASGFSFPYKESGRLVAKFAGSKSEPVSLDIVRITNFRVETFGRDDSPELVGEGPDCLLNIKTKEASSAGALTVAQFDGRLRISGEGFWWSQATGRLVLSNNVHTVFHLGNPTLPKP